MCLPCLAFSREPFCIGVAAGCATTAPGGRGLKVRDKRPRLPAAWSGPAAFSSFTSSFSRGQGSLASEMIPAGRLGGRTDRFAALVCLPAVVVIRRR